MEKPRRDCPERITASDGGPIVETGSRPPEVRRATTTDDLPPVGDDQQIIRAIHAEVKVPLCIPNRITIGNDHRVVTGGPETNVAMLVIDSSAILNHDFVERTRDPNGEVAGVVPQRIRARQQDAIIVGHGGTPNDPIGIRQRPTAVDLEVVVRASIPHIIRTGEVDGRTANDVRRETAIRRHDNVVDLTVRAHAGQTADDQCDRVAASRDLRVPDTSPKNVCGGAIHKVPKPSGNRTS